MTLIEFLERAENLKGREEMLEAISKIDVSESSITCSRCGSLLRFKPSCIYKMSYGVLGTYLCPNCGYVKMV